ncbi:MAG TPA: TonB-dependent receptor, partial [Pyrinomonadaceae bacterium]|nr:TonB-dependent receptor [Pyrinomonadaceae bacterium]
MFKSIAVLAFILLVSITVFAQSGGKISGKVIFGGDNSTLHGVSVRIAGTNQTTVTDDDGTYAFANIAPGKYTIIVHQEGFADQSKSVTVGAGQAATLDFEINITGVKEQVTVTGSGVEESAFESIATVSSVDSNLITERAAVGIGEVLDKEPGVSKRSFGPGNSRPVIRGFDGDRVLVSTDGVRTGSLGSQSGDHSEPVDIFAAERIEVVKGPATLLYGSNAIGGVVNAISGHDEGAHPGLRGRLSIIGGSNNSQASVGGGLEYGTGPWMLWGNASGQRTGDYKAGG